MQTKQFVPDRLDYDVYFATIKIREMVNQSRKNLGFSKKNYPLVLIGSSSLAENTINFT